MASTLFITQCYPLKNSDDIKDNITLKKGFCCPVYAGRRPAHITADNVLLNDIGYVWHAKRMLVIYGIIVFEYFMWGCLLSDIKAKT